MKILFNNFFNLRICPKGIHDLAYQLTRSPTLVPDTLKKL